MRWKTGLSAAFFTAYLAVQVGVPLVGIPNGERVFCWDMFSANDQGPEVSIVYPGGARETHRQLQERTGRARIIRAEIDPRFFAPYLCSMSPAPKLVILRYPESGREDRVPCRE